MTYEIKTEDVYEGFCSNKEIFDFSNYSAESKGYNDSNKLVISKMKDETAGVMIEEFVGLKPKIYSFLVDENSEHKKAKSVNKNVAKKITHSEYKDELLNSKLVRHLMNRIESIVYRIETYETNKILLPCCRDEIYIQDNGYNGLALG